jgi:hypothetical protein
MMRRRVPLLLALPIAAVGSLLAHQLAYLLSDPIATQRARVLAAAGHGYLRFVPMLLTALAVTLLVGLALEAVTRRRPRHVVPAWPLALIAPLAFALQEHVERALHAGAFPSGLVTSRTFLVGLALQVPFALLAWGIAVTLGVVARTVGQAFRGGSPAPVRAPLPVAWPAPRPGSPRPSLDPARSLRAPPPLASSTA